MLRLSFTKHPQPPAPDFPHFTLTCNTIPKRGLANKQTFKKPAFHCIICTRRRAHMPVLPLLFISSSRKKPLRVSNPIRYNRRNLSQPYPSDSVRCSEAIFHSSCSIPLSCPHHRHIRDNVRNFLCKALNKVYSLRHCVSR